MSTRIEVTRRWISDSSRPSYFEDTSVSLEALPLQLVTFLVGDPGAGKTDSVRTYVSANKTSCARELFSEVISRSQVEKWLRECFDQGKQLFLDAYDEKTGTFRRGYFLEPLIEAINDSRCPVIRVVSRGAHLPQDLVNEVQKLLGLESDAALVFRLQPLSEEQIRYWARERLGDAADGFFKEVEAKQLEPYLGRPVDLEAFLASYRARGTLGNSPTEAWSDAILQELDESNPDRLDPESGIARQFTAPDRLRMAEILALAQSIGEPSPIWIDGITKSSKEGRGLTLEFLWRQAHYVFPELTKESFGVLLRETVQSRFFEIGSDGITFASAAKAQFLSARFLRRGNSTQIINLLKDHLEGTRIPERAQPVAAEIAKFVPELFDWLCVNQPDVLLRGVVLDYSDTQRAQIVDAVLSRRDKCDPWGFHGFAYRHLAHPGLDRQLRPYIQGKRGSPDERNLAVDIADYARCAGVAKELAEIACDSTNDLRTRVNAAHAVARIGGLATERLRPLLSVSPAEDEDDELFGCALMALWPYGFTPDEAFRVLREPRETAGLYHGFLTYDHDSIFTRLTPELLLPGLAWLAKREKKDLYGLDEFDHLALALTKMAWDNLAAPSVATALAKVAEQRLEHFRGSILPFRDRLRFRHRTRGPGIDAKEYGDDRVRRRMLFRAWLRLPRHDRSSWAIPQFFDLSEVEELIKEAKKARGRNREVLTRALVSFIYTLIQEKQTQRLNALKPLLSELGLDLSQIRKDLRAALKYQRPERPRNSNGFDDAKFRTYVGKLLAEGKAGDFPTLLRCLAVDLNGWQGGHDMNLTAWSRWKGATAEEQNRVLELAKQFLALPPSATRPSRRFNLSYWDWAGLTALMVLTEIDSPWLAENFAVVRPWLPMLASQQNFGELHKHPVNQLFSKLTPQELGEEIRAQIRLQVKQDSDPLHIERHAELWREDVGYLLAQESRKWAISTRQRFVMMLAMHQHPALLPELRRELQSQNAARRDFGVRLVLTYGIKAAYPDVAALALGDDTVLNQAWELLWKSPRINTEEAVELFGFDLLKRFFERAVQEVAPEDDLPFKSGPIIARVEQQRLRDSFASAIAKMRSDEAQEFVATWASRGFSWLERVALKAKQHWLESSWTPPTIESMVKLTLDEEKRFLSTQRDLLDAVLTALEAIRSEAQTQAVYWKDVSQGKPADEPAITQNLALLLGPHLSRMVVNAEVSCLGGRTDIQIEAVVRNALGEPYRLKCVVEAKRCDNRELLTGIDNQLVRTYLPPAKGHTGVYLVLWFCPRSGCRCEAKDQIRGKLQEQADKALSPVSVVHFEMRSHSRPRTRRRGA